MSTYHWTWDAGNRITNFYSRKDAAANSSSTNWADWASATYLNDDTNQLTDATYANWTNSPSTSGEDYNYDANGNRQYTGQTNDGVGPDNQLAADGTNLLCTVNRATNYPPRQDLSHYCPLTVKIPL